MRYARIDRHRAQYSLTLMSNGGYNRATGEAALKARIADLISFGHLFLANPDVVERFAWCTPLNEPDPDTFDGGGTEGYIDYLTLEETGIGQTRNLAAIWDPLPGAERKKLLD